MEDDWAEAEARAVVVRACFNDACDEGPAELSPCESARVRLKPGSTIFGLSVYGKEVDETCRPRYSLFASWDLYTEASFGDRYRVSITDAETGEVLYEFDRIASYASDSECPSVQKF